MPAAALIPIPGFTDPFSSLSHLAGAAACLALSIPLVRRGLQSDAPGKLARISSLVVFATSAIILLSMSGVYHLLSHDGPARDILQRLDHAAIFVLIAGTFTPIHAIMFHGLARWGMLLFIWSVGVSGVALKTIFFADTPPGLGIALYLGMGWLGAISMAMLARRYGAKMVAPIALGGVAYTAGAAVEWLEPAPLISGVLRAHEVLHIAVLIGLALHWWFVWSIASGKPVLREPQALPTSAPSRA